MNPLPLRIDNGTVGELYAQLLLLLHGVQAAPPLKDTGNDLIACKGDVILALQIKTRKRHSFSKFGLPRKYHGVIFVVLNRLRLEQSLVYLMTRRELQAAAHLGKTGLHPFLLKQERV